MTRCDVSPPCGWYTDSGDEKGKQAQHAVEHMRFIPRLPRGEARVDPNLLPFMRKKIYSVPVD